MNVFYYYCNRAGTYRSEGTGKRQLKTQGTAKTGSQCSAYIKAVQDINTKCCSYCPTHYNHTTQIPLTISQDIAKKFKEGEFQRDMLKTFDHDTVCIDTTHGTNMYHFNLIILVVIDEYREGIPVVLMLCNREDAISLIPFFAAIKGSSGVISPSWLMSVDADNYFNTRKAVFGEGDTKTIICVWLIPVDRTWRKALAKL